MDDIKDLKFMLSEEGKKEFEEDIKELSREDLEYAYAHTHWMLAYTMLAHLDQTIPNLSEEPL